MKTVEACSKMAQREDLFGSTPTERPLIQEFFTTRYDDLDTGFNERDYSTASKEGERIENLQLSERRAYEIDLERKRAALEDGALEDVLNVRV